MFAPLIWVLCAKMNETEFRDQFAVFLNDTGLFKKFVATINRNGKNRLLFWQESSLQKFCSERQIETPSFSELSKIFRICEIHSIRLEKGAREVFGGEIDYSPEFTKAAESLFPYSNSSLLSGTAELHGQKQESWFCAECRQAEKVWRARGI